MYKGRWLLLLFIGGVGILGAIIMGSRGKVARGSAAITPTDARYFSPSAKGGLPLPTSTSESEKGNILLENPASPTMQALTEPLEVRKNGITVRLVSLDTQSIVQGKAMVRVCFSIPTESLYWMVSQAHIETNSGTLLLSQGELQRYEQDSEGTVWRCEDLIFEASGEFQGDRYLEIKRVVIEKLLGPHPEKPDCTAIQKELAPKGIKVAPVEEPYMGGCRVVEKPDDMDLEEAQALVGQLLSPERVGPWVFQLARP